jgi:hypothetical protein
VGSSLHFQVHLFTKSVGRGVWANIYIEVHIFKIIRLLISGEMFNDILLAIVLFIYYYFFYFLGGETFIKSLFMNIILICHQDNFNGF